MYMGVLFLVVTIVLSLFEQTHANYMVALIFLGLGGIFYLFPELVWLF